MQAILPTPIILDRDNSRWDPDPKDPEYEMIFWPRIVFGDMGTFSGVTVIWFDPVMLLNPKIPTERSFMCWWSSFMSGNENVQAREFLRLCRGLGGPEGLCVGLEKFIVKQINASDSFLSSPRTAAKIDFGLWSGIRDWDDVVRRRVVAWQNPEEIDYSEKGDYRLKQLDMFVGGMDHRNDATKHAILHLRKMKNVGRTKFELLYGWNEEWEEA